VLAQAGGGDLHPEEAEVLMRLAIDSSNLGYMAAYTTGEFSYEEASTGVVFGFLNRVFSLAAKFKTKDLAFFWDSRRSFRKVLFANYKSNRAKTFSEPTVGEVVLSKRMIQHQIQQLRLEIIPELGFKNSFIHTGLEADDLIAWFVTMYPDVLVVSSDNDLFQLLGECRIYNSRTNKIYTKDEFEKEHGFPPTKWAIAKALMGCSTDEVPGIPGIGPVRVRKYMEGTLEDKWMLVIKSIEGQRIWDRNMDLVLLPFGGGVYRDSVKPMVQDELSLDKWVNLFDRLGFRSFLIPTRLKKLKETFGLQ
jgi:5'-3' exonuclease